MRVKYGGMKATVCVLVFLMLMSATASGVLANEGNSSAKNKHSGNNR